MTGIERMKEEVKDQNDVALNEVVNYLVSRKDMESKFLKEEKSLKGMRNYIRQKGEAHSKDGWNFIINEVVYAWAIMYFSLPNEFLKIDTAKKAPEIKTSKKDNIVLLDKVKEKHNMKKSTEQLTLFGGTV